MGCPSVPAHSRPFGRGHRPCGSLRLERRRPAHDAARDPVQDCQRATSSLTSRASRPASRPAATGRSAGTVPDHRALRVLPQGRNIHLRAGHGGVAPPRPLGSRQAALRGAYRAVRNRKDTTRHRVRQGPDWRGRGVQRTNSDDRRTARLVRPDAAARIRQPAW